jgi:hypothetical protein
MASGQWEGVAINTPTAAGEIVGPAGTTAAAGTTLVLPGPTQVTFIKTGANIDTITMVSESLDGGTSTFDLKCEGGAGSHVSTIRLSKGVTVLTVDTLGASSDLTIITARSTGRG